MRYSCSWLAKFHSSVAFFTLASVFPVGPWPCWPLKPYAFLKCQQHSEVSHRNDIGPRNVLGKVQIESKSRYCTVLVLTEHLWDLLWDHLLCWMNNWMNKKSDTNLKLINGPEWVKIMYITFVFIFFHFWNLHFGRAVILSVYTTLIDTSITISSVQSTFLRTFSVSGTPLVLEEKLEEGKVLSLTSPLLGKVVVNTGCSMAQLTLSYTWGNTVVLPREKRADCCWEGDVWAGPWGGTYQADWETWVKDWRTACPKVCTVYSLPRAIELVCLKCSIYRVRTAVEETREEAGTVSC